VLEGKRVAVVVPCYNEESKVGEVLDTMPAFVDCVIVVDDTSQDGTVEVVRGHIDRQGADGRIVLIEHEVNGGVGAAIVTGYRDAIDREMDVVAVMAGDAQMDPDELDSIVGPVARGETDYTKGNRLFYRGAWETIPRHRYLGNAFLSMLTKIASGYWHVADSQTGYTAITRRALETIQLDGVYPRYGYPNDMLVRLNVYNFRVSDIPIRPVYHTDAQSKMRIWKVIPTMSWLVFKRFLWRMKEKYVIHDFHPLVLFYAAAGILGLAGFGFFVRLVTLWIIDGRIPPLNALIWVFCLVSSMQFGLFAMWFDMETNRELAVRIREPEKPSG
jgi:glycosyltransferase involved in cell wall biosynthesis